MNLPGNDQANAEDVGRFLLTAGFALACGFATLLVLVFLLDAQLLFPLRPAIMEPIARGLGLILALLGCQSMFPHIAKRSVWHEIAIGSMFSFFAMSIAPALLLPTHAILISAVVVGALSVPALWLGHKWAVGIPYLIRTVAGFAFICLGVILPRLIVQHFIVPVDLL